MAMRAKTIGERTKVRRLGHRSRTKAAGRHWYQTAEWKRLRKQHLSEHPYCIQCQAEGKPLGRCKGNTVDHKEPHNGDREKFFDSTNLQTLCASHHSRKTAQQDGGFGNTRRQARGNVAT